MVKFIKKWDDKKKKYVSIPIFDDKEESKISKDASVESKPMEKPVSFSLPKTKTDVKESSTKFNLPLKGLPLEMQAQKEGVTTTDILFRRGQEEKMVAEKALQLQRDLAMLYEIKKDWEAQGGSSMNSEQRQKFREKWDAKGKNSKFFVYTQASFRSSTGEMINPSRAYPTMPRTEKGFRVELKKKELIEKFRDENGRLPDVDERKLITEQAKRNYNLSVDTKYQEFDLSEMGATIKRAEDYLKDNPDKRDEILKLVNVENKKELGGDELLRIGKSVQKLERVSRELEREGRMESKEEIIEASISPRYQITREDKLTRSGQTRGIEQMKKEQAVLYIMNSGSPNYNEYSQQEKVAIWDEILTVPKEDVWRKEMKERLEGRSEKEIRGLFEKAQNSAILRNAEFTNQAMQMYPDKTKGDAIRDLKFKLSGMNVDEDQDEKLAKLETNRKLQEWIKTGGGNTDDLKSLKDEETKTTNEINQGILDASLKISPSSFPQFARDMLFESDEEFVEKNPVKRGTTVGKFSLVLGTKKAQIRGLTFNPRETERARQSEGEKILDMAYTPETRKLQKEQENVEKYTSDLINLERSSLSLKQIESRMKDLGLMPVNMVLSSARKGSGEEEENVNNLLNILGKRKLKMEKDKDELKKNDKLFNDGWNMEKFRSKLKSVQKIKIETPEALSKGYSLNSEENYAVDDKGRRVSHLVGILDAFSMNQKQKERFIGKMNKLMLEKKYGKKLGEEIHKGLYDVDKNGNLIDAKTKMIRKNVGKGNKVIWKTVEDTEGKITWEEFMASLYGNDIGSRIRWVGGAPMKTDQEIGEMASKSRYRYRKKLEEQQQAGTKKDTKMIDDVLKSSGNNFQLKGVSAQDIADYINRNEVYKRD